MTLMTFGIDDSLKIEGIRLVGTGIQAINIRIRHSGFDRSSLKNILIYKRSLIYPSHGVKHIILC